MNDLIVQATDGSLLSISDMWTTCISPTGCLNFTEAQARETLVAFTRIAVSRIMLILGTILSTYHFSFLINDA